MLGVRTYRSNGFDAQARNRISAKVHDHGKVRLATLHFRISQALGHVHTFRVRLTEWMPSLDNPSIRPVLKGFSFETVNEIETFSVEQLGT